MAVLLITTLANAQDRSPLGEFRRQFLNQRIVVNQNFSSMKRSFLGDWRFVTEKKGVYTSDYLKQVPATFASQAGTIIAVLAPFLPFETPSAQTDETYVKYAEAVVKLDSGELIETAVYTAKTGTEAHDAFTLTSMRDQHRQEATTLAKSLNGKALYLTRLTRIYDMGLTTEAIQVIKTHAGYSEAQINDAPLLTALPVIESRYSEKLDFSLIVLQLPNGKKAIYVPGCVLDELTPKTYDCASTSMPSFLTEREIEAIRKGSGFIGISETALYMAMGFPKETNKSVVGLTQLVYLSAYVYLDNNKQVVEFQDHH
jgi:hypothetical protein